MIVMNVNVGHVCFCRGFCGGVLGRLGLGCETCQLVVLIGMVEGVGWSEKLRGW